MSLFYVCFVNSENAILTDYIVRADTALDACQIGYDEFKVVFLNAICINVSNLPVFSPPDSYDGVANLSIFAGSYHRFDLSVLR